MPRLSVITINYNDASGLKKTMESVFTQTYTDYEYIIIDGGSTDGSKEIIEQQSGKLAYWVSENDKGVYHAMNKGIKIAQGAYLLFLNSGDYFYSDNSLLLLFNSCREEEIVYGNIMVHAESEKYLKTYPAVLSFQYFLQDTLPHPATLIKRALLIESGLYSEDLKIVSDWKFFMNAICLKSVKYKACDEIITVFCTDGISSHPENMPLIDLERKTVLRSSYSAFLPDYNEHEEGRKKLRNISNSRLHAIAGKLSSLIKYFK